MKELVIQNAFMMSVPIYTSSYIAIIFILFYFSQFGGKDKIANKYIHVQMWLCTKRQACMEVAVSV